MPLASCDDGLMKVLGVIAIVVGAALTAYAIPPASYVALGAIALGVASIVSGIRMIRGAEHA